ncbi:hypothetical protein [Reichenbachiella sp.]|uniref:hypothetical protein n=1 Tax=Reichenbachiella sp. TaxID=2184521 RepID=UPI003B5A08FE
MTKNIIIGVLSFLIVFFVLFANIKASEAEKQSIQAELNLKLAMENETKAKAEQENATKAAAQLAIAEQKVEELKRALEVCK